MTADSQASNLLDLIRNAGAASRGPWPPGLIAALNAATDPDVFITLGEALAGEPELVRAAAATAIGEAGNGEGLYTLESLLQDLSALVRGRAVFAVEQIGAVDELVPMLAAIVATDPDPALRMAAVRSLGIVASPQSDAALRAALAHPDPETRATAEATCERFGRRL